MTYANPTERQALISGLREFAGFLENHPEVPAPTYTDVLVFPPHASDTEISCYRHHYMTSRQFGPVEYRAVAIPADETREP